MRYIRYVAYLEKGENPWHQNGLFTFAHIKKKQINPRVYKSIKTVLKWYNKWIPCPPENIVGDNDVICWWKIDQKYVNILKMMRIFTRLLRYEGYKVKVMKTNRPGKIIYRDEYQIVAEMPKNKRL